MDPFSGQWIEHFLPGKPIIVTTTIDSGLRYVYVIGCTSRLPPKLRGLNCGSSNDLAIFILDLPYLGAVLSCGLKGRCQHFLHHSP